MNNQLINQSKEEITEALQETINLRQQMPTTNKQKNLEVKELFQEIVQKLENSEIYFEGDGRQFFLFNSKYQIKIGELQMEFKNHNGYEGEDWNREFKEQLAQEVPFSEAKKPVMIIYVDAFHHKWVVAAAEIGLIAHGFYQCEYSRIEGEAYAMLQGVRWAIQEKVTQLKIVTNFRRLSDKNNYEAESPSRKDKYYRITKQITQQIAQENHLELELEWIG